MERGVYAFLGISRSCALETMQSYVENFKIPFISLSMPQESKSPHPFQLFMRPSYIDGLLDIIQYYKWNRMIYVYYKKAGKEKIVLVQNRPVESLTFGLQKRLAIWIANSQALLRNKLIVELSTS